VVLARLRAEKTLAAALADADHVQENAPERLDLKKSLFAELDHLAPPGAVLASSSSAILPSLFTEQLPHRKRCLVIHPINPPYLIPAVEVVPAPWTSPEIIERARAFLVEAGQAPIVMKRELDGFVMNRMQGALLEEAFRLVADGFATTEDIDVGIREGLALRWSFMGPFETIDLNAPAGVRDYVQRYEGIYSNIFKQTQRRADWAGPVLAQIERERRGKLRADQLGERQKWRDQRLMALAAHKRRAARDVGA
jgi:3-hydroxyacyl-CoA dehydrogenase